MSRTRIYLDNAATTPLDEQVLEAMLPFLRDNFGNPSSIHGHGRTVRAAIEKARKKIAELLNAAPAEIFFTSSGTEADNMAIRGAVAAHGLTHIITSRLEHHAVLHTVEHLARRGVAVSYVQLDEKGHVDFDHLETLLRTSPRSLVTLMHGNNEIGNLLDIGRVAALCAEHDAFFHSDTVQTLGHYAHDLQTLPVHCLVGSAHKFHGPKGIGFLYMRAGVGLPPLIFGGSQERNMRGGTENVYGIVGLAAALEQAYTGMDTHRSHVEGLKTRLRDRLLRELPGVAFNGDSASTDSSLYTVLSVCFPPALDSEMLLFNLDIAGISASGGSACTSGSNQGSHVLRALGVEGSRASARFSFSKYNTTEEIDAVAGQLLSLAGQPAPAH